jgi:ABC-type antimicrobial peptide transport system permease subunit
MSVLKTIGFTRSQLSAVVACESNVAVAIGTIVGIPVGIVVGRTLGISLPRGSMQSHPAWFPLSPSS